jgi:hypothetical protein
MNTKFCVLFILFAFLVITLSAQEPPPKRKFDFPRRNSIYLQNYFIFPSLNYDRVIPFSDHFGVIPKIGIEFGLGYGNNFRGETSIFIGGNKHYGEIGVGIWERTAVVIPLNYRYIGKKGLIIKAGFGISTGIIKSSLFAGIGYSF